ncbi:MAG TPA: hypothetical protein VFT98_22170 [Myxococcota bacterium]|nr:hypothetical protein [Myxococcota bacterium]
MLLALAHFVACGSPAPPPEQPRVVAPPEAPAIVTPPPAEVTICQRDAKPTAGADAATIASFEAFSHKWVAKMKEVAAARATATSRTTLRNTYEMELRATGSAQAPFVGVLSYCEIALTCTGAQVCQPASSTVVKEMFRYQAGNWVY